MERNHCQCQELSKQNREIAKVLADNPRLMLLLKELMSGTPLRVALVASDLVEDEPLLDDDDYESYNYALAMARDREIRREQRLREKEV